MLYSLCVFFVFFMCFLCILYVFSFFLWLVWITSFLFIEEEAKALVLSTGILESLQSASDPCSVVTQLQESLELNQEALADPAPETTRLIRSFSVMAKCENRLDVVQRLRQITPAGTTGVCLLINIFLFVTIFPLSGSLWERLWLCKSHYSQKKSI